MLKFIEKSAKRICFKSKMSKFFNSPKYLKPNTGIFDLQIICYISFLSIINFNQRNII